MQDFEKYKYMIADRSKLASEAHHTMDINGTQRNIKWVQYNLLQYCKHPLDRRFHPDERTFHNDLNHHYVSMEIDRMIGEKKIRLHP